MARMMIVKDGGWWLIAVWFKWRVAVDGELGNIDCKIPLQSILHEIDVVDRDEGH